MMPINPMVRKPPMEVKSRLVVQPYMLQATNVPAQIKNVEVIDDDSTKVTIGNRRLTVSEDGNVKWCKVKRRKFNGHWAGVELGINGFLTKDFNMKVEIT